MAVKNPLKTFGISAVFVTRNARPGKCILTLIFGDIQEASKKRQEWYLSAASYEEEDALPGCLGVLADADQRRLDLRVSVHRAPEVLCRDVVLPKIRVGQCDDKVVICTFV
jgi:hypothetical protein